MMLLLSWGVITAISYATSAAADNALSGKFAPSHQIGGKALKLIGTGTREKFMFKIYAIGVYSESGVCDAKAIISADEVKYMRLELLRDLAADKFSDSLKDAFERVLQPADPSLKQQTDQFLAWFKTDGKAGSRYEFTYDGAKGTTLTQNGVVLGTIPGKKFADLLWSVYYGEKTCCQDLQDELFKTCKK